MPPSLMLMFLRLPPHFANQRWRDLKWHLQMWMLNWTEKWRNRLSTFGPKIQTLELNLFELNYISLNLIASSIQVVALIRIPAQNSYISQAAYKKTELHLSSSAGLKKLCGKRSRFGLLVFTLKKKHCTFCCLIFPVLPRCLCSHSSPTRWAETQTDALQASLPTHQG